MDTTEQESITGRDDLIMAQALLYAIKYIDGLPRKLQEPSNRADMAKILLACYPGYVESRKESIQFTSDWARDLLAKHGAKVELDDSLKAARDAHLGMPDLSDNGWGARAT